MSENLILEKFQLQEIYDFLKRDDAITMIEYILNNNIKYEELFKLHETIYISENTPFTYLEVFNSSIYFEIDKPQLEVNLEYYKEKGCGYLNIVASKGGD